MISLVIPLYNEKNNVYELHKRILNVMNSLEIDFEIIFVDDCSTDGTYDAIKELKHIKSYRLARNYGQTSALSCGIEKAKGDIIVTLDGDLENQPEDIPLLLKELENGYDMVNGWRKNRWSTQLFSRKFPSLIANLLISKISKTDIHDHGCGIKAYRSDIIKNVALTGDMHRMIPAYLAMTGARITEIPVNFKPRLYDKSKYGFSRSLKVLMDVIAYYFFRRFSERPIHFFGYSGLSFIFLGFVSFLLALFLKLKEGIDFDRTPLPVLVAIFVLIGFQFILMGLLAEIMVRLNKQNFKTKSYEIKDEYKN